MKKKQTKFLIAGLVVVVSIGYLMYAGIKETSVYYLTVPEATAMAGSREDLRIEGNVVADAIEKDADSLGVKFQITDKEETKKITVYYKGTIPDMFDEGIDVVVQGKFDGSTGIFKAHTLLTSCPSKYEASEKEKDE